MKKKIKKFSFTPLSEHFEIWVWKPAMDERVNKNLTIALWKLYLRSNGGRGIQAVLVDEGGGAWHHDGLQGRRNRQRHRQRFLFRR